MNAMTSPPDSPGSSVSKSDVLNETRTKVRDMLTKSQAFLALPLEQQRDIAHDTVEILRYLAAPEGIPGPELAARMQAAEGRAGNPLAKPLGPASIGTSRSGGSNVDQEGKFVAQGAREGAYVAGALLQAVNFPAFVSGLIDGVFHSIVDSSIKQMEAYGRLVADVAKSLNQFRDENVTSNQGRDHLVDQFPDTFMIDVDTGAENGPAPRVRLRDGVEENAALQKVNSLPLEGGPLKSLDLEDEETEEKLVQAARTQLATSRQQLLATMVLMGINRIIVTDGRISAKVMYDFQAKDNFKFQRSATKFDYADKYSYTSEGESESEIEGGERSRNRSTENGKTTAESQERDGSYYSKGKYKNTAAPLLTLASASQQTTDAALSTRASLAGSVEVNFKSETFPLEKMADSFQIGMIQNASKPASKIGPPARTPAGGPEAPQPAPSPATTR